MQMRWGRAVPSQLISGGCTDCLALKLLQFVLICRTIFNMPVFKWGI